RVIIDGTPRGTTPLLGVALSPSVAHRVELVNDVLGTRAERSVRLDAGERDTLIVDLQSP
ncbi:MAG: hypothetical protein KC619_15635, partial [Myxococcales bacterium]|nr:hypothetical protein [Myxococcales bacterium]